MENIELLAAETLLQRGVRVQIVAPLLFRLFGKKKLSFYLYQPSLGNKIRITRLYLKMGITADQLNATTQEDADRLLVKHSNTFLRMLAIAMMKGRLMPWLFNKPLAYFLKYKLSPQQMFTMVQALVLFSGTADFMNTTRLFKGMKITEANLGQTVQGS